MTQETTVPRYRTYAADELPEVGPDGLVLGADEDTDESSLDRAVRYLTWGILAVCLALWAVVGFIFWIPLVLRSILHFSFALSQSMLQGTEPVEAGRVLRETVGFYRRGFTVAIDAVFGTPKKKQQPAVRLSLRHLLNEMLWATVIWYLFLYLVGFAELSPVGIFNAVVEFPWGEMLGSFLEGVGGLVDRVTGGSAPAPPA
ncbi:MAG TPA: hypothetical protein VLA43_13825 [Longimicrobiales bacterium]|nr:hypothetical protein [Longimicrobiales bacterium]